MRAAERRRLGVRGPEVPRVGLGCAPLGNLYSLVSDADAQATVDAAWDAGLRWFDTAPLYGHGLAEQRVGLALADRPRDDYVLSTKVGRLLRPVAGEIDTVFVGTGPLAPVFDFSRGGVLQSIEESLERLGIDRLDVVLVHDPDDHEAESLAGAFPALVELRDQGVVGAIGAGMNQWEMLDRFVQQVDLDVVLLAGRYTLLDRGGGEVLLPRCADRGVGVVLGGVFNSGVLADPGPNATATYDYAEVPPAIAAEVRRLRTVCHEFGVSLPVAALQFGLRHEAVSTIVVGARSAAEVGAALEGVESAIPDSFWDAI